MTDDESQSPEALQARLVELRQEHADLDAAVHALTQVATPDLLLIGRLKRRKLSLKDQIARLEDMLTPDIIA
jgi:hypothetical protein